MGPVDIIKLLEKQEKPLSRGEIATKLKLDPILVSHSIKRLLKARDIECIEVDRNQAAKLLNSKSPLRRMRFYYVGKEKKKMLKY